MFKRLVLGMVSLCACAMPRGHSSGGKVRAGSPYVVAHNEEIIWVTRTLPGEEEATALFACYRPPANRPGPPTCYRAAYVGIAEEVQGDGRPPPAKNQ